MTQTTRLVWLKRLGSPGRSPYQNFSQISLEHEVQDADDSLMAAGCKRTIIVAAILSLGHRVKRLTYDMRIERLASSRTDGPANEV